ncbi:hypothetical protein [Streptomyces flavofungini]|uniref:Secreted protein n=1 Tax=Streptomyces flavofungini TaxID=68200 RepID=A0ABS0WY75_9ACTN|nr:hypothetical protein [Streptomyces flavofungini]MBJ3805887.1 hypothetical protein [Streptomyces flavofungini]
MTSARRLMAAVSLAAGAAALAAPAAHASTDAPAASKISVLDTIDDLQTSGIPAERRHEVPTVASQLGGLNQLHQLHQLTDLAAPVTNAVPAVQ